MDVRIPASCRISASLQPDWNREALTFLWLQYRVFANVDGFGVPTVKNFLEGVVANQLNPFAPERGQFNVHLGHMRKYCFSQLMDDPTVFADEDRTKFNSQHIIGKIYQLAKQVILGEFKHDPDYDPAQAVNIQVPLERLGGGLCKPRMENLPYSFLEETKEFRASVNPVDFKDVCEQSYSPDFGAFLVAHVDSIYRSKAINTADIFDAMFITAICDSLQATRDSLETDCVFSNIGQLCDSIVERMRPILANKRVPDLWIWECEVQVRAAFLAVIVAEDVTFDEALPLERVGKFLDQVITDREARAVQLGIVSSFPEEAQITVPSTCSAFSPPGASSGIKSNASSPASIAGLDEEEPSSTIRIPSPQEKAAISGTQNNDPSDSITSPSYEEALRGKGGFWKGLVSWVLCIIGAYIGGKFLYDCLFPRNTATE